MFRPMRGSTVKLKGESREYIGEVVESLPTRLKVKIGEAWINQYNLVDGVWVPTERALHRKVPRTQLIGVVMGLVD